MIKSILSILTIVFFFGSVLCAQSHRGDILIKNAWLITIAGEDLPETDIRISDGKIAEIGKNLRAGRGVRSIDARGKYVMPGIVDAHSHMGIDVVNEASNPVTAEVDVGDALDPFDISIYRALAGGVTVSHAMHGSANVIGGECETIKHRYGLTDPDDLRMEGAPRTIKFALGENPMRVHGQGKGVVPATRMGIEAIFRKAFAEAEDYSREWTIYRQKRSSGTTAVPPKYNHRMEVLADVLEGDILIHCHSYRADEILMLMDVCRDFGIEKICFQHVNEGYKVAPELAEFGASASIFSDWWAYKFEVYYSTAYNAAILSENEVVTSINSDSRELIRHLYHEAAKAQRYGNMSDREALKMITINPAKQLGIDHRVGSLELGKDGDLAIFSGHPLSIYSIPEYTIVDGIVRFDREMDRDDMRLFIDPDDNIYTAGQHEDGCLQDVKHLGTEHEH